MMRSVTRFEANLLRLLGYFLGREPVERALPLVENRCEPPPCLGRDALELVKNALAKGSVSLLARRGGWRRERFLRGDQMVEGRLWERTPPGKLGLHFSRETLAFLLWITACQPGDQEKAWHAEERSLASGDLLLLFFAHEGLRQVADTLGAVQWRARPPLANHGLCQLAYPEDFPATPDTWPNFAPWLSGVGACILEALQPELVRRWAEVESGKARLADPGRMEALGATQERVLSAFLDAADKAGRWDLARFLLQTGSRLLGPNAVGEMWVGGLRIGNLRLADRAAIYRAALAFVRVFDRLHGWARRARAVGRFDDGYQAAQLWKADWEQYQGDVLTERAQGLIRRLDPLRQG